VDTREQIRKTVDRSGETKKTTRVELGLQRIIPFLRAEFEKQMSLGEGPLVGNHPSDAVNVERAIEWLVTQKGELPRP
jgi:hypothetical protein